ncbi:MAG: helix-turn-helix domain-containing protein [Treponema sp.]|jgi:transcriptional regulator with XRE-family HTH domain|nr:helix-turn-helix domain-containing protein [Treponema sp.]
MGFAENLRDELDYQGLIVKELAAKTGINIHTLNHYLSGKKSMPPADTAVKIAAALNVSVEYLVNGNMRGRQDDMAKFLKFRDVLDDLLALPEAILKPIKSMIKAAAQQEKKRASPS